MIDVIAEELMVGTVGWDHDVWIGTFYPDDLPDDWRFAYYSNDYRAVLVTADHFSTTGQEGISEWVEDCDEAFGFVAEIPRSCLDGAGVESLQVFLEDISPLRSRTRGFLVSLDETTLESVDQLQPRIELLQNFGPVCFDIKGEPETPGKLKQLMTDCNVGRCWHPEVSDAPVSGGALMLALSSEDEPRGQRKIIEVLEKWMRQNNSPAGLFLNSPAAASQARIIAEMLGV